MGTQYPPSPPHPTPPHPTYKTFMCKTFHAYITPKAPPPPPRALLEKAQVFFAFDAGPSLFLGQCEREPRITFYAKKKESIFGYEIYSKMFL